MPGSDAITALAVIEHLQPGMHILFVTSEVAGVYKIGGLADVSLSLPLALEDKGIHVTVAIPYYASLGTTGVTGVGQLAVDYAGKREIVFLFQKKLGPTGGTLLLFRHPRLNDYRASPIEETFAFYSKVVATFFLYGSHLSKYPIDIVHCHDWHTALVPLLIGESNKFHRKETLQSKNAKTIITIHNLMYQGVVSESIITDLDAPRSIFHEIKGKKISFLREGFEFADRITTVSPTYAKEIVESWHHDAIGDTLQRRRDKVVGILNGINPDLWKPSFSAKTVFSEKPKIKNALQQEVELPEENVPLFGFVGRIEPRQKGIDIVMDALLSLLEATPMQVVILGTGESVSEKKLSLVAKKYNKKMKFINTFDDTLARRIYAGSDVLMVPSKFEPCGLTQMIAMRYGTIPLVRATGGLVDSVVDTVTGFIFDQYSAKALSEAILRAHTLWFSDKAGWRRLMEAAMKEDFSWDKSAGEYVKLYKSLV